MAHGTESDAVTLFVDRARAVRACWDVTRT
jgi:hypothetical protein